MWVHSTIYIQECPCKDVARVGTIGARLQISHFPCLGANSSVVEISVATVINLFHSWSRDPHPLCQKFLWGSYTLSSSIYRTIAMSPQSFSLVNVSYQCIIRVAMLLFCSQNDKNALHFKKEKDERTMIKKKKEKKFKILGKCMVFLSFWLWKWGIATPMLDYLSILTKLKDWEHYKLSSKLKEDKCLFSFLLALLGVCPACVDIMVA